MHRWIRRFGMRPTRKGIGETEQIGHIQMRNNLDL